MKITKELLREMIAEELAALDEAKDPKLKKMIEDWNKIQQLAIGANSAFVANFFKVGVDENLANAWLDLFNGVTNSAYKQVAQILNKLEKETKSYGLDAKTAAPSQKDVSDVMPDLKKSGENLSNKEYNKALYQYLKTLKIVGGMKGTRSYGQELSDLRKQRAALLKMREKDPTLPEPAPIT
jgi:TPP-dependent 2-oxoacid decarboxylase